MGAHAVAKLGFETKQMWGHLGSPGPRASARTRDVICHSVSSGQELARWTRGPGNGWVGGCAAPAARPSASATPATALSPPPPAPGSCSLAQFPSYRAEPRTSFVFLCSEDTPREQLREAICGLTKKPRGGWGTREHPRPSGPSPPARGPWPVAVRWPEKVSLLLGVLVPRSTKGPAGSPRHPVPPAPRGLPLLGPLLSVTRWRWRDFWKITWGAGGGSTSCPQQPILPPLQPPPPATITLDSQETLPPLLFVFIIIIYLFFFFSGKGQLFYFPEGGSERKKMTAFEDFGILLQNRWSSERPPSSPCAQER